jgi:hypothetical protein
MNFSYLGQNYWCMQFVKIQPVQLLSKPTGQLYYHLLSSSGIQKPLYCSKIWQDHDLITRLPSYSELHQFLEYETVLTQYLLWKCGVLQFCVLLCVHQDCLQRSPQRLFTEWRTCANQGAQWHCDLHLYSCKILKRDNVKKKEPEIYKIVYSRSHINCTTLPNQYTVKQG